MSQDITIHVGTIGQGLWRSLDGGNAWQKGRGVEEHMVRAITVFPDDPSHLMAGADHALLSSHDNGSTWQTVDSYTPDRETWSITVDPTDPNTIFAGGCPGLRRSHDGGQSWDDLPVDNVKQTQFGVPRTTSVVIDPLNPQRVYAGVEVDGVHKSLDGGHTWTRGNPVGPETLHDDIHDMARVSTPDGVTTFATNPFGIARSADEGESWSQHEFPPLRERTPRVYCRAVLVKHDDPSTLFVVGGDTSPGITGTIQRSTDGGQSWEPCHLQEPPNSMFYWLASHPDAPNVIAASTLHGYIYLSEDGGDTWRKLAREFGEVRGLAISASRT